MSIFHKFKIFSGSLKLQKTSKQIFGYIFSSRFSGTNHLMIAQTLYEYFTLKLLLMGR